MLWNGKVLYGHIRCNMLSIGVYWYSSINHSEMCLGIVMGIIFGMGNRCWCISITTVRCIWVGMVLFDNDSDKLLIDNEWIKLLCWIDNISKGI